MSIRRRNTRRHLLLLATAISVLLLVPLTGSAADANKAFFKAVKKGDTATVRRMLDDGADVNATNKKGGSALMRAAIDGNDELLRLLIERGAELDARTNKGKTALMLAVRSLHTDSVNVLLEYGADVTAQGEYGMTALMMAAEGEWECELPLHRRKKGNRPSTRIIAALTEHGADVNAKNEGGRTALVLARGMHSSYDVQEHMRIRFPDRDWKTRYACEGDRHFDVVKTLIELGADVNATDNIDATPLMRAAYGCDLRVVRHLLEHGADVSAQDKNGKTALKWATYKTCVAVPGAGGMKQFRAVEQQLTEGG